MEKKIIFWGKVIKGKQRGRSLGFPTANIRLRKNISHGIYISKAIVSKKKYFSITFIGNNKTFGENEVKAETYFINSTPDLYGKWISICLIKKIRENIRFKSEVELISQMHKDLQIARKYFKI